MPVGDLIELIGWERLSKRGTEAAPKQEDALDRGWAEGRMATTEHRTGLQEVAGEGRRRGVHLVRQANRPSTGTRLP